MNSVLNNYLQNDPSALGYIRGTMRERMGCESPLRISGEKEQKDGFTALSSVIIYKYLYFQFISYSTDSVWRPRTQTIIILTKLSPTCLYLCT